MLDAYYYKQIRRCLQAAGRQRHRLIIHVMATRQAGLAMINDLLAVLAIDDVIVVDNNLDDPVKKLRARLGAEAGGVLINAFDGVNPNVLGITSGLVKAGGIFILLTPPLNEWADYPDPDYQRMQNQGDDNSISTHRFIQHLITQLHTHAEDIIRLTTTGISVNRLNDTTAVKSDLSEQNQLITRIQKVLTGRARKPLVIEADRGRGKSAALGIASGQLLQSNRQGLQIGVTSVSQEAVNCLFYHATQIIGQTEAHNYHITQNGNILRYFPIDQLIHNPPRLDLLIVDEAAALPVSLLQSLLESYTRLVFSTTIQGYEGNGQGFAIRFTRFLTAKMPAWRRFTLTQPIRFNQGDPLENLVNDLLLLNAHAHDPLITAEPIGFRWIQQDELLQSVSLLAQVFGLLISAHYQTSPDDLRLLFDHPSIKIAVATQGDGIVAVALVMQEGNFTDHDKQQLVRANRRFKGHIVPQMLKNRGIVDAINYNYQRIMRIAVAQGRQRQGIGTALLAFIYQESLLLDCDFLSVSFSCEADVLAFWQNNAYRFIRLGTHKSASTGLYSVCLLRPVSDQAKAVISEWFSLNADVMGYQLLAQNRDLPAAVVNKLLQGMNYPLHVLDKQCGIDYGEAKVAFESVQPSLYRLYWHAITNNRLICDDAINYIIIDKLLLNRPWSDVAKRYGLTGRKQIEKTVRSAFLALARSLS